MTIPDLLRVVAGVGALALVPVCIYCMFRPIPLDQRVRYGSLALLAVIIVGAQLANLGQPLTWRTPALIVAVAGSLWGCAMFLVRTRRDDRRP